MNILDIYKKYQIMPQLMEHQLRVAAVAKLICENFTGEPDTDNIVKACLFHDIGNIIKFDISITDKLLPGMFSKQDLEHWQKVKDGFIEKYGTDEHHASIEIVKEVGAGERVVELVDCIGFQNGQKNADSGDFGKKICAYSDMRVGPYGIISLEKRFLDLRARYENKHRLMGGNENLRLEFEDGLRQIEKQIFAQCKIRPKEITDERVEEKLEILRNYEI